MSQKTLNLCLERYKFVKFGETAKSSHTVLCINNAYSVNSDKYRLTPTAIASKHGDGYVFTLNYDFDRPLFTIAQKSYSLDGTSGNIVFEGIDPISKGGSKYLRKVTVSPVKLSDGTYLLEVTNDEYLRIGTTGAALGDEELESLNEKIVAVGGIKKSVETVGGKQVLKLDAGGPSGAKEIVYFEIDPSDPPSGIYEDIGEVLSNNKIPVIKIDGAVYFYTATGTDEYVFVGGYRSDAVEYITVTVSDDDSVEMKSVEDNMIVLVQSFEISPYEDDDGLGLTYLKTVIDDEYVTAEMVKTWIDSGKLLVIKGNPYIYYLTAYDDQGETERGRQYRLTFICNATSSYPLRRLVQTYLSENAGGYSTSKMRAWRRVGSPSWCSVPDEVQDIVTDDQGPVLVSRNQYWNSTQKAQGRDNIGACGNAPNDAFYVNRGGEWVKAYSLQQIAVEGFPVDEPDNYEKIGDFNGNLYPYFKIEVTGEVEVGMFNYDTKQYDAEFELSDETHYAQLDAGGSYEIHAKGTGIVSVTVSADSLEGENENE